TSVAGGAATATTGLAGISKLACALAASSVSCPATRGGPSTTNPWPGACSTIAIPPDVVVICALPFSATVAETALGGLSMATAASNQAQPLSASKELSDTQRRHDLMTRTSLSLRSAGGRGVIAVLGRRRSVRRRYARMRSQLSVR